MRLILLRKRLINSILKKLSPDIRDFLFQLKRYNFFNRKYPKKQIFILFVDGKNWHGGLCDRFKGIVSVFQYCLINSIEFRIHYTYPFELSDYLLPNEYDWRISEDEISRNIFEIKYMNMIGDETVSRLIKLNTKRQMHFNANQNIILQLNAIYNTNYQWGELFKKLFKPTEDLKNKINNCKRQIESEYICVQFRFQNLLGDVVEREGHVLKMEDRYCLIEKSCKCLLDIQEKSDIKKILVTSDSSFFLQEICDLENIYVFIEKTVHIDNQIGDYDSYLKSFLDFFLLSEAKKIYSAGTDQMWKTEFPLYAAKLNNIPFERILIK